MTKSFALTAASLILLAGNLSAQVVRVESSYADFSAGAHNATYVAGSDPNADVEADYYGRASGLAAAGADTWQASSWKYRRPLTLNSSNPSALSNYAVKLTLDTQSLISGGFMNADGSDLRFYPAGAVLSAPYYIESGLNTSSTRIWVKLPTVSTGTSTLFMYYGSTAAAAASSMADTFVLGSDFTGADGSSPSTSTWVSIESASPAAGSLRDIQSDRLRLLFGSPLNLRYFGLRSAVQYSFAAGRSYRADVNARNTGSDSWSSVTLCPSIYTYSYDQDDWLRFSVKHSASGPVYTVERSDYGIKTTLVAATALGAGMHGVEFLINSSSFVVLLDGSQVYAAANNLSFNSPYIYLEASDANSALDEFLFDNVSARPYSVPEPAYSSAGTAQGRRYASASFVSQAADSGAAGTRYNGVNWNSVSPSSTSLSVEVRASDTDVSLATFTAVSKGADPGVSGRYVQYRLGFSTLDPRYTASVSSVAISYGSPPLAPSGAAGQAQSVSSIKWTWTDTSSGQYQEDGFKILDGTGSLKGSAAQNAAEWTETGLNANTQYQRQIAGYNSAGTGPAAAVSRYTLAASPSVSCDRSTGTWLSGVLNCSNLAGFGANGVAYYRYVWTTNPNWTWSGTETQWTSGSLSKSDFTTGNWYLHVKSYNGDNVANSGYTTYGPYWYDTSAPTVTGFSPSSYPWTNTGLSVQGSYADTGGSKLYAVQYRWTTTTDKPASGWQAWDYSISGNDAASTNFTIGTAGQWYLHVQVQDVAGNIGYSYTGPFRLDLTNPTGGITINSGDTYTPSVNVTLALSYSDSESGVKSLEYKNLGAGYSVPELPQAVTAWALLPGDGSKQVYLRITDNAGNTQQYADTITLDSRTSLLGAAVNGTASGVMGEPPEGFNATASLAWTPTGAALSGKTVNFYFNGSTQTAVTNVLGSATTTFYVPQASGTYVYNISFSTDGTYSAGSSTGVLTAGQRNTSLTTEDVNATSGNPFTAKATLKDLYTSAVITGATVTFHFEGSTVTALTDGTGVSTVTFTAPGSVGTYNYYASYDGDGVYAAKNAQSRVGVGLRVTSLVLPGASALAGSDFTAQSTLLDGTAPVSGAPVSFYFQGSTQAAVTDGLGVATHTFTAPASSGTYPFSASFPGNGTYTASAANATLTVNRRPLSLAGETAQGYVNASFQARAVLYDGITAAPAPGKAIVFVFEGSSATAVTDAAGVSTAVFSSGSLPRSSTCYYYFSGDPGYAFADSTKTITIDRRPVSLAASNLAAMINSSFTATAQLKDMAFSPVGITGKSVTFVFAGSSQTALTDPLGMASATYQAGMSTGTYEFYAYSDQDSVYVAGNDTGTVTLSKRPTVLTAYPRFAFAFDAVQTVADLKDGITGEYISSQTVSFNYNGVFQSSVTGVSGGNAGRAYSVFSGTGVAGSYGYSATFAGNSLYSGNSSTSSVSVTQRSVNLSAFPVIAIWSSSFTAVSELRDAATNALISGKTVRIAFSTAPAVYSVTSSGVASSTFTAPASTGTFSWFANFAGDPAYAAASSTGTVTVNRRSAALNPVSSNKYVWDSIYLSATFADGGAPLQGKLLSFSFMGSTMTAATNAAGTATAGPFTSISTPGAYGFSVSFGGDPNYSAQSGSSTVTITARPSSINVGPVSAIAASTVTLSATLIDTYWTTPVTGKTVSFTLQGATFAVTSVTDASGIARANFPVSTVTGPYTYSATFAGNTNYSGTSSSETLTVTLRPAVLEMADYYPPAASTFTVSAVLKDYSSGAVIQGKTLTFYFITGSSRTVATDALGYGTTNYAALSSTASYPISASFPGDSLHSAASVVKTVFPGRRNTALLTSDLLTAVALDSFTVTARLSDYDLGTYLGGYAVSFSFTGSTYTLSALTNSTGIASATFTAPASTGAYTYTATFGGTALYNGTINTSSVLVNRRTPTLNPSDLTGVPATSTFTVSAVLSDGALTLPARTLAFVFSSTLSAVTDGVGVATSAFAAPLSTGTFLYKVTFNGDALYDPATAYASVSVVLKPTVLEVLDVPDAVVGLKFTATAKLRDIELGNALVIATKTITMTFRPFTVTYTSNAVTEGGVSTATFVAPPSTGTYSYTAVFAGDGIYGASQSSGAVVVNRRPVLFSLVTDPNQPYAYRANAVQSSFTITATLSDGQVAGLNLPNQTIRFIFQSSTMTAVTNSLGVASVTFPSPVSSGTYHYYGYFDGDNSYNPNKPGDSDKLVSIIPRPTNILPRDTLTGILNFDGQPNPYYTYWNPGLQARLIDTLSSQGIQGLTAKFVLWNSTITGVTDSIGTAASSSTFSGVSVYGTYPATVRFDGDGTYDASILPGGTNTADPYTAKIVVNRSPAYFDVPQITETYPDADTVITGSLIDWWNRPAVAYPGRFVGDPNGDLRGYPFRYRVSTIPCPGGNNCTAFSWTIEGWGNVGAGNIATATVRSPAAAGDYPIDYYFATTNSFVQWNQSVPQRILRVGRRLTYIIPDAEPFTFGAQRPVNITVKLADLTQSLAGVNGKNLDVVLVTTQTLVTGSAGPAGKVTAAFPGMAVGTYTYIARFPDGDPAYMPFTSSGTVVIEKNVTALSAMDVLNVPAGNSFTAKATLSITVGTTSIPMQGKTVYFVFTSTAGPTINQTAVTDINGVAQTTYWSPYVPGTYNYTASFPEDADNKPSSDLLNSVQVVQRRTQLTAQNAAVYILENFVSSATLVDNDLSNAPVSGKTISFVLHGGPDTSASAATVADGSANVTFLSPASSGTYQYSATFPGDPLYAISSDTRTVTVSRRVTNLNAADVTAPANSTFTITTSLSDVTFNLGVSTPISGVPVKFVFNSVTQYANTDAYGVVSATFTSPLVAATYPYSVTFEGTQTYGVTTTPRNVIVRKRNTTVSGSDLQVPAGSQFSAQALLIDEFGQKMQGYAIDFVFTGGGTFSGSAVTDVNGLAAYTFTAPVSTGIYNYTASYAGDATYAASTDAVNMVDVNVASTTISTPDGSVLVNDVFYATATLTGKTSGVGVENKTVRFTYAGAAQGTGITDVNGIAVKSFTPLSTGTYRLDVNFDGDSAFYASAGSATITVNRRAAGMALQDVTSEVSVTFIATVTLQDVSSLPPVWIAGRTVDFLFNGVPQSAVTSAVGVATVTYTSPGSSGVYPITAAFNGDAIYNSTSTSASAYVAKHITTLTVDNGPATALELFIATATLKMNGTPVPTKNVAFYYKGTTVTATTDANGQAFAQFSAGPSSGPWRINGTFDGSLDPAYDTSVASATITVLRRTCRVIPNDVILETFQVFNATVTFMDVASSSTPAGKIASVAFNWTPVKSTYTTTATNASGIAYRTGVTGPVSSGTYRIEAFYTGDATYEPSLASTATVSVARRPTQLSVGDTSTTFGQVFTATATLKNGALPLDLKPVRFTFEGRNFTKFTDATGVAMATFTVTTATGPVQIQAVFDGDDGYFASNTATATVTTMMRATAMTAPAVYAIADKLFIASGTLKDFLGLNVPDKTVSFVFNAGTQYGVTNAVGVASASFTAAVSTGVYPVAVSFAGDFAYAPSSATLTLTVNRRPTSVIPFSAVTVPALDVFYATATLRDLDLLQLASKPLRFVFQGSTFSVTTDGSGIGVSTWTAPANSGTYYVYAYFDGDGKYEPSYAPVTVTVQKRQSAIALDPVSATALDLFTSTAALSDPNNGSLQLSGKQVAFAFSWGGSTAAATNAVGTATAAYTAASAAGTYQLTGTFAGDATYASTSTVVSITVAKRNAFISGVYVSTRVLDSFTATGLFKDSVSSATVSGRTMKFVLQHGSTLTATTNGSGLASAGFTAPASSGTYYLYTYFDGDPTYNPAAMYTSSVTLARRDSLIVPAAPAAVIIGSTFTPTATLYDAVNSATVSSRQLDFLFQGSTKPAATTISGVAAAGYTANTSSGAYQLQVSFSGDATYNPSVSTAGITALRYPTRLAASSVTVRMNEVLTATATLTDYLDGPAISKPLVFTFQSQPFASLTDSGGIARSTYTASVASGTYSLPVTFAGDALYDSTDTVISVLVTKRDPLLQLSSVAVRAMDVFTATATLADAANPAQPIAGQAVNFELQAGTYTLYNSGVTGADGVAVSTFSAPVSTGTYQLLAHFPGSSGYYPAVAYSSVAVGLRPASLVLPDASTEIDELFMTTATLVDQATSQPVSAKPLLFTFGYSSQAVTGADGKAAAGFTAPASSGAYQLDSAFAGDATYGAVSSTATLTVNRRRSALAAPDIPAIIDEIFNATATLTDWRSAQPANGRQVSFYLASTTTTPTDATGTAFYSYAAPASSGTYYANISFAGDARFLPSATTAQVLVDRRPVAISPDAVIARAAQVFTATAALRDVLNPSYKPAGRAMRFIFSGSTFTALTDANGIAVSTFMAPPSSGTARLDIAFDGDARYRTDASSVTVAVLRRLSSMTIDTAVISAMDLLTATATLRDLAAPGVPVNGRTLTLIFSSKAEAAVTDAAGVAVSTFAGPASSGTYTLEASFAGDDIYDSSSASGTVTVLQRQTGVNVADSSAYPFELYLASSTMFDAGTGAPVAGRAMNYSVGASSGSAMTNAVGVATAPFTPPVVFGNYQLSASFPGDATYAAATGSGTVSVMQRPTVLSTADVTAVTLDTFSITAFFTDVRFGTPIAGREIGFSFNGQVSTAATDATGYAAAVFTAPASSGAYNYTAEFLGDSIYAAGVGTGAVTINTRPTRVIPKDTTANSGQPFTVSATLVDPARQNQAGYLVPGAQVQFDFKDKTGFVLDTAYGITDELGVATVTFTAPSNPDVFYFDAKFGGDFTYSPSSGTAMIKVGLLTSLVAFDVVTDALETFTGKAKLTDYLSTTLDDKLIRFKFLGAENSGMTAADGVSGVASSTFTAPASSGTYQYMAYFDGDSIYSPSNTTATVKVNLRTASFVTYPASALAYSSFTAMIALKDLKTNNSVGGRNVDLIFNGSTVPVVTDPATGIAAAQFFAPASSGAFSFYADFAGDNTYAPAYATGTLSVSLRPTSMLSYNVSNLTASSTFTAKVQIKDGSNHPVQGLGVDFEFEGSLAIGQTDAQGFAQTVFTAPAASGTYKFNAVFYGDIYYSSSSASGDVSVGPRPTLMFTPPVSSKLGSPLGLSARLVDVADQSGIPGQSIDFYFEGSTLTAVTDALGVSSITFAAPVSTGTYPYKAEFHGGGATYLGSSSTATATIALNLTRMTALGGLTVKIYEPFQAQATLTDYLGVQLQGLPVLFTFGADISTGTTSDVGLATVTFQTLGLASTGTYNYTAEYYGDTLYTASSDTSNIVNVNRRDPLLVARDALTTPLKQFTAAATLYDNVNGSALYGSPVSGREISFALHYATYTMVMTATTSVTGVSSATFTAPISTGSYLITAALGGADAIYEPSFSSATLTVFFDDGTGAIKTKLAVDHAESYISRTFVASGTLTATGIPVPGEPVLFEFFNGIATYTAAGFTDGVGLATAAFTAPAASGTYQITASFAGDVDYSAASGTNTLTAYRYPTSLAAQAVSTFAGELFTAKAVLRDVLTGAAIQGKSVAFDFFDGVSTQTLTGVTSSTGSAEVVFTAPAAPIDTFYTARFAGDPVYSGSQDEAAVLIASKGSSTFLVGYDVFIGTGEVFSASATLTSKGYPVPGKPVSLTFEGVTRVSTTNAAGVVFSTFSAPAASGTFVYAASFAGDQNYNAADSTGTVSVVMRVQVEQPTFKVEVTSTQVTVVWKPIAVSSGQVSSYAIEESASFIDIRKGVITSSAAVAASSAATLGYTMPADPDNPTYIKIKTKLADDQESPTSLVVEVPSKAEDPQRVPNYYYMSPGANPQDWAAWVKIPGKVMDKVGADTFSVAVEKSQAPGFLAAYTVTPSGASSKLEEDLKASNKNGVKLTIAYPQSGTGTSASTGQLAIYWFNGVEWVKLGGEIDVLTGELYTYSRVLGQFAVRAAPLASSFSLTKVAPRIFTPEEASTTVNRARFYFENPGGGEVTIRIFDITGALVRRNLESESSNIMFWNGKDQSGAAVKGGIYLYQIEAGEEIITGTVVVAK